ncbi:MAG TPA: hypothetical protein VL280_03855 [Burkholderiales bacterium]|jgi:hypothetical protein|nr:hypothetical protein [Burkholderiales bacterium]
MILRNASLRLGTIGALAGLVALAAAAADQQPAASPCQKLTGADRTECERLVREKERQRPEASRPEPAQDEPPPPDTKSEGNDESDTGDPPRGMAGC